MQGVGCRVKGVVRVLGFGLMVHGLGLRVGAGTLTRARAGLRVFG